MFKHWRIALIFVATAALSILISACGSSSSTNTASGSTPAAGGPKCVSGTLKLNGSTALAPLAKAVAADYQAKCPGSTITINPTGSGAGLTAVDSGNADIGLSDIFADKTKFPALVDHQVAAVVFSVVINKDVTGVTDLTSDQIKGIFTGKTTNWKELKGPDLPIVAVSRPDKSGTRVTFETFVLGTKESVSGASHVTASTTGDVAKTVGQTSGAISYVATSAVKPNNLTSVKIDGVSDSDENVKINTYKFWNLEHLYTKGQPSALAQAFIDYMKSDDAKKHADELGFLQISSLTADAVNAKQPKA